MPIDIQCDQCQSKFRVADKYAGKRVKCPSCKGGIAIPTTEDEPPAGEPPAEQPAAAKPAVRPPASQRPAPEQPSPEQPAPEQPTAAKPAAVKPAAVKPAAVKPAAAKPAAAKAPAPAPTKPPAKLPPPKKPILAVEENWYLQTEEGEQYGPVTRQELDQWMEDGRVDASCQILCDGWEQWKWAEEVYPQLAESPEPPPAVATEEVPVVVAAEAGIGLRVSPEGTSPAAIVTEESTTAAGEISRGVARALAKTRPWVLFLSILGFVISALGILGALFYLVIGLIAMATAGALGLILVLYALVIGGMCIGLFFGALKLFGYASRIGNLLRSKASRDLDAAMVAQSVFWKTAGILTIIWVLLSILMPIIIIVVALATASGASHLPRGF